MTWFKVLTLSLRAAPEELTKPDRFWTIWEGDDRTYRDAARKVQATSRHCCHGTGVGRKWGRLTLAAAVLGAAGRLRRGTGILQSVRRVQAGSAAAGVILTLLVATTPGGVAAQGVQADDRIRIVALGDSLTAGLGVAESEAFPAQLQRALASSDHNVEVINAGVSGDTSSGGLARLDWSVPDDAAAVIVELGANDALRGIDPAVTRKALDGILGRLGERRIPVLLAGMRAPPNMGPEFAARFDAIYPDLARKHDVLFYPFFLEGVAAERRLNQKDGIHPTAEGVETIVRGILPKVEELIGRIRAAKKQP